MRNIHNTQAHHKDAWLMNFELIWLFDWWCILVKWRCRFYQWIRRLEIEICVKVTRSEFLMKSIFRSEDRLNEDFLFFQIVTVQNPGMSFPWPMNLFIDFFEIFFDKHFIKKFSCPAFLSRQRSKTKYPNRESDRCSKDSFTAFYW